MNQELKDLLALRKKLVVLEYASLCDSATMLPKKGSKWNFNRYLVSVGCKKDENWRNPEYVSICLIYFCCYINGKSR